MPVSNVNNTNSIIKLALAKKAQGNAKRTYLPEYMQMTGSIFKSPQNLQQPNNLSELNTRNSLRDLLTKSLAENKSEPVKTQEPETQTGSKKTEKEKPEYETSVAGGEQAIADNEAIKDDVSGMTSDVKSQQKDVQKIAQQADKLDKTTQKDDKKFLARYQKESQTFKKQNDNLLKIIKETEEAQKEIDDAQNELDSLIAANQNSESSSTNNERIKELQQIIGCRVAVCQKNGKAIYSLRRSQNRTIHNMNRNQVQFLKAQNVQAKQIEAQQAETNDVIDFASEVEKWSAVATSSGQALGLLGKTFVAIGSASSWLGGFGAALISIGEVMIDVGATVELVGQYGQTAANLTKSVAYAAEGNLMGAMMSTASAIQTGTACIKGTKELKATYQQAHEQAEQATQKLAAKTASDTAVKDAVNTQALKNSGMTDDALKNLTSEQKAEMTKNLSKKSMKEAKEQALGGMTEKQARKYMAADIQKQMQDGKVTGSYKELVQNAQSKTSDALDHAKTAYNNANNTARNGLKIASDATSVDGKFTTNVLKKNGTAKTVSEGKLDRLTNKNFKNAINNIGAKNPSFDFNSITKLGNSVSNIATVISTNSTMKSMSTTKKTLAPAQLDARTQRIMQRNQRYRAARAMYA